jgi:transcriptional regulator with XRE-family HTH domain
MEFDRLEALRIGQELKRIRKQRGLSLAEVETLSSGRWKAVVIGSYERADRAITVGRLSALMALYQAPIGALFPMNKENQNANHQSDQFEIEKNEGDNVFTFDLNRRAEIKSMSQILENFISHVINTRGDWNGHVITVRKSDLRNIAICEGRTLREFIEKLRLHRVLVQWR